MPGYNFYGQSYGNPYGYGYYPQNYQVQPQTIPTQQTMQPQQSYQPMTSPSGIIWVSGAQEAQMFPITPNNAVALWEKSGKTIYLKQADATGKPTITVYDLVERKDSMPEASANGDYKTPDYAREEDLGKLAGVVKTMNDIIGNMRSDIDGIKSDMYGVVGSKKKTAKKVEAVDDDDA